MKVVTINSSPRNATQSKTSLLLSHLIKGMRSTGAEVTDFDIHDTNIDYCTACFACFNKRFNEEKVCIHEDDMTLKMLPKWREANLVVYGSPVFFHSITAKLKTFLERTLPVYVSFDGDAEDGAYDPTQQARHPSLAFLSVSGSPEESAFDDFRKYVSCFDPVAEIYRTGSTLMAMPFCKSRVDDILEATELAGVELVQSLKISASTMARITQPLHDDAEFIARVADAHQTLLPGHRALMSFPAETRRELRSLPDVNTRPETPKPANRRRERIRVEAAPGDLQARLDGLRQQCRPDDIAIIGASGRFGTADNLDQLWTALETGRQMVGEVTRWDLNGRYQGKDRFCRHGALLADIAGFDARFFKISGQEARFMDPQQRVFLEECWHALENAGYAGSALKRLRSGVYAGCSDGDYRDLFDGSAPPQSFWGNAPSVIASRIAYVLDLEGPALGVDTACSSALVAIDLACRALRSGEIDLAIAGAVMVQCTPRLFDAANNAQMLSPTGHCYAFDARADGFVLGEGAGALILRRLKDALAAGDPVWGVVKASGTNQDGATNGLTAPSAKSQTRLLRAVQAQAQIDPGTIQMVEAHGTGTKLGDPIEFAALNEVFGTPQQGQRKATLGTIKANIGHAGAAAGLAGIQKVLLSIRHKAIPATLNFAEPNPALQLSASGFDVSTRLQDWPTAETPRRACVSAFGFSGTNAHLVIEEPPQTALPAPTPGPHLVGISGASEDQLRATLDAFAQFLTSQQGRDVDLGSLSLTLLTGRAHKRYRFAVTVSSIAELVEAIRTHLRKPPAAETGKDLTALESAARKRLTMLQRAEDRPALLASLEAAYLAGIDLPFDALFTGQDIRRIALPKTPFMRRQFWATESIAADSSNDAATLKTYLKPIFEDVTPARTNATYPPYVAVAAPGHDAEIGKALGEEARDFWAVPEDVDDATLTAKLDALLSRSERMVWLAPKPSQTDTGMAIASAQAAGVLLLFRALKLLQENGNIARSLTLSVITQQTVQVQGEPVFADHAAIHGLVGSTACEMSRWRLQVVDLPLAPVSVAGVLKDMASLPRDGAGVSFAFRNAADDDEGPWYRRRLVPTEIPGHAAQPAYRQGGVYIVIGGAGGIGRAWSEHVVRHYGAQVIWLGRRPCDPSIEAALDALATYGPRPEYLSVDAADADALHDVRSRIIALHGKIDGVVHSAIVLHDATLATMTMERFQAALRPKIDVSLATIEVFGDDDLDFVVFFSSMIAFAPSPGQSNYAAGCAFKDAFAVQLRTRLTCPVKIINWGYWGDVGIVAEDDYRQRMTERGMASITAELGNAAVEALLTLPESTSQLAYMVTSRALDVPVIDQAVSIDPSDSPLANMITLEKAVAPVVRAQLARIEGPGVAFSDAWITTANALISPYPAGPDSNEAWNDWRKQQDSWVDHPELATRARLLDAALTALPQIMRGGISGTDVLFPGGSSHLVEGLYRNNQVADAFNLRIAQTVVAETRALSASGRGVRILEIGAGTGGTTDQVVQCLQTSRQLRYVSDYAYTDISSAFFKGARAEFGERAAFFRFETLDIERHPQDQGFELQCYDLVIASNVLHATRDVARALRHAKTLLRPGGLLILNELSQNTLLTHLTFGTLESWWAFEDTARRLPGGPVVTPEVWREVLAEEGFLHTQWPAQAEHHFGQQILLARSDGMVQRSEVPRPNRQRQSDKARDHVSHIQQVALSVLGGEDPITASESFSDFGLDSLTAAQMVQTLNSDFGTALKASDIYSYSTPLMLAQHINSMQPKPVDAPSGNPRGGERPQEQAVAIIGVSMRAPGVDSMDELWEVLKSGKSLVSSSRRWPGTEFDGAYFDDIAGFDPEYFNITGLEARYMDPQQRAFLMEGVKALEDAGYSGASLMQPDARRMGVFAGCYPGDYFQLFDQNAPAQSMWGAAGSVVPARLSYFLDLSGPAVAVDTACSSALVAIHLACQSLRNGDCNMAIAGGVTLFSTDNFFAFAQRANMLSPGGRCHTFDARADGFVPGEGVGAIILKPLSEAVADGDNIQAVIIGSGTNQDGASNGITAPNGLAQQALLNEVYRKNQIDPATIGMIEAHGTGTKLGDPVEFDALVQHFRAAPPGSIGLGSVKATLGHTLAAAGIFGLFRALLAIKHDCLPPLCGLEAPNPELALEGSPFVLNQQAQDWREGPKRAGISAFGFSGTNAHVVLQEPPRPCRQDDSAEPRLFVFSAQSQTQLKTLATRMADHLGQVALNPLNVSYTLLAGRDHHAARLAIIANDGDDLQTRLRNWAAGRGGELASAAPSLEAAARQFIAGGEVDTDTLFANAQPQRVSLPTYPFDLKSYWVHETQAPAKPPPMAQDSIMLTRTWQRQALPVAHATDQPQAAKVGILTSENTQALALRIAARLGDVNILPVEAPISEEIDTLIDCRACADLPLAPLDWLPWPQALARRSHKTRYLVVSRGQFQARPRLPDGGTLLGALAKILSQEYSKLSAAHVDFETQADDAFVVETVARELWASDEEPCVFWRNSQRFVQRTVELEVESTTAQPAFHFPADQAVWITGGVRGLGLLCAHHLVERYGVKHLILSGRSTLAPREDWHAHAQNGVYQYRELLDLIDRNVNVEVLPLNLDETDRIAQKVKDVRQRIGPIGGLIHCAGIVDQATPAFIKKTPESVAKVLAPKTTGLEALWGELARQGAERAILFSSLTAAEPALAVSQSDYAMANAFMDAFAAYHTQATPGCRMLSLQWPNWREAGMGEVSSARMTELGYPSLSNTEGLALLDNACRVRNAAVILPTIGQPKTTAELLSLADVEDFLSDLVAGELELSRQRVIPATPFADYGVDSILISSIRTELANRLETPLDPSLLYERASITSLAQWLIEAHPRAVADLLARRKTSPAAVKPVSVELPKIAVTGMSCRFPGGADLAAYWQLIRNNQSAIDAIPDDRAPLASMGHAALLKDLDLFDPGFYRLPLQDARAMSAQARLALDGALAALCHSGYTLDQVKGRDIGVYLGARARQAPADDLLLGVAHPIRAVGQNYLASTISNVFDLRGPAMVIDSACSSAFVAMHTAIQALRAGEISAALVGGVNVLEDDGPARMFNQRGLGGSQDRFHVFDKRADGVILGEGCGMVMLKTLDQALADGDAIHAVVEAIALNNDGRTAGPSAPNFEAQGDVMRRALAQAQRSPADVGYIELNGSGHPVTDLLELKAIAATYGNQRASNCALGSIKPNIGHPLTAEAIASFIKVVCMLEHEEAAPCLSGAEPMEFADLTGFELLQRRKAWADLPGSVAAINVFADGGTNAHALVSGWVETRNAGDVRKPIALPPRNLVSLARKPDGSSPPLPTRNFWRNA